MRFFQPDTAGDSDDAILAELPETAFYRTPVERDAGMKSLRVWFENGQLAVTSRQLETDQFRFEVVHSSVALLDSATLASWARFVL